VRIYPARGHAVHRDATRRQLYAQPLHQRHQRSLRSGVVTMPCLASLCCRTGYEHDSAIVSQCARSMLRHMEHAVQVHVHRAPPLLVRHLRERHVGYGPYSMVANKAVKPAECLNRLSNRTFSRSRFRQVTTNRDTLGTEGSRIIHDFLGCVAACGPGDSHTRTACREQQRGSPPDAARATRHQNTRTGKPRQWRNHCSLPRRLAHSVTPRAALSVDASMTCPVSACRICSRPSTSSFSTRSQMACWMHM